MCHAEIQYDFFISYSRKDKPFVDALVHYLEADSIRCWYAPRDIAPGFSWAAAITQAMKSARAMVLVLSESSNCSQEVVKEITLASNHQRIVVPVRIDNVSPNEEMQYHIGNRHWLDVFNLEREAAIIAIRDSLFQYVPAWGQNVTDALVKNHGKVRSCPSFSLSRESGPKKRGRGPALAGVGGLLLVLCLGLLFFSAEKVTTVPALNAGEAPGAALPPGTPGSDIPQQLERSRILLQKGREAEARAILEPLAQSGNAEAQSLLGDLYYRGLGGPVSMEKAAHWYGKAAEQNDSGACYNLACLYYDGQGVAKDYARALRFFLRAADRGDSAACFAVGEMYENGKGVNRSVSAAYSWYLKAAEAGDTGAQYKVGVMLYEGNGAPQNREQGMRWLYQAAENGEEAAEEYLR